MAVEFKNASIFTSTEDVLVNPVNCKGVMGAGLALEFKNLYPKMFEEYKKVCDMGRMHPGDVLWYKIEGNAFPPHAILCAATKDHWRAQSDYNVIADCLKNIIIFMGGSGYNSIALPYLGCGLGGLSKDVVGNMIKGWFKEIPISVVVYDI